ncbi:hypothetical protein RCL1_001691 [Eukaryota sp. TZLM3-RCL]
MRRSFHLILVATLLSLVVASRWGDDWPADDQSAFILFQERFDRNYVSGSEVQSRFEIFQRNRIIAKMYNDSDPNAFYGITRFSDLTPEEFKQQYLTLKPAETQNYDPVPATPFNPNGPTFEPHMFHEPNPTVPFMWDWRNARGFNFVTPVKNQGSCGMFFLITFSFHGMFFIFPSHFISCYAFAAAAAAESYIMIKPKGNDQIEQENPIPDLDLNSLSPQSMVDCTPSCYGCNGGMPHLVYEHFMKMGWGIPQWIKYGYTGKQGQCRIKQYPFYAKKILGYSLVNPSFNWTQHDSSGISAEAFAAAIYNNGPLAMALDAQGLQFYYGGVISSTKLCSWAINHAVTGVGYAPFGMNFVIPDEHKERYEEIQRSNADKWEQNVIIIKNSWGDWGEEGYFRVWMIAAKYPINPQATNWGICGTRRYASFARAAKQ